MHTQPHHPNPHACPRLAAFLELYHRALADLPAVLKAPLTHNRRITRAKWACVWVSWDHLKRAVAQGQAPSSALDIEWPEDAPRPITLEQERVGDLAAACARHLRFDRIIGIHPSIAYADARRALDAHLQQLRVWTLAGVCPMSVWADEDMTCLM